jgi:hypothetical protein
MSPELFLLLRKLGKLVATDDAVAATAMAIAEQLRAEAHDVCPTIEDSHSELHASSAEHVERFARGHQMLREAQRWEQLSHYYGGYDVGPPRVGLPDLPIA